MFKNPKLMVPTNIKNNVIDLISILFRLLAKHYALVYTFGNIPHNPQGIERGIDYVIVDGIQGKGTLTFISRTTRFEQFIIW